MNINELEAVFFDFDGVILDSEWPVFTSWRNLFQREGQELSIETYAQCIGSDFTAWSPQKLLEELTGKTFCWDHENALRQTFIEESMLDITPLEGVIDLFELFKEKKIPMAVVSSSVHSWVDTWLEKLNLTHYFQQIICRGDAPRIKPAPDLYLKAIEEMQLTPQNCLVIEDSLNGVQASLAAGCKTCVVPTKLTSVLDLSAAHYHYPSMPALFQDLRKA